MNVRTRDETVSATVVELLDIETLAELEQFKSNLITHGFRELHQVASPDGTVLLPFLLSRFRKHYAAAPQSKSNLSSNCAFNST